MSKLTAWVDWSGGYEELVRVAREVLREIDDPAHAPDGRKDAYAKAAAINERLVRQYVGLKIVSGAERTGRKLTFRYPQLLQLLVARHLIAVDGWKLQQIKTYIAGAKVPDLERTLPAQAPTTSHAPDAMLADNGIVYGAAKPISRSGAKRLWASANEPFSTVVRESLGRAQFAREAWSLRELDLDPEPEDWVRFRLTPWTEVHVRESALEAWDDSLVEALAQQFKDMLRAAAEKRRKRRR